MWDWLLNAGTSVGSWLKDGQNLKGVGDMVGGFGQAYGAIAQDKAAREMLSLQKDSYNEEKKRRAKTQLALDQGFSNLDPTVAKLNLGA